MPVPGMSSGPREQDRARRMVDHEPEIAFGPPAAITGAAWHWQDDRMGPLMLLDTASLYFRAFYGVPETLTAPDGTPDIGTVQYLTTTDARSNQYTIRVDHELRPGKDRLYGYFYRLNARTITPGIRPDFLRPR